MSIKFYRELSNLTQEEVASMLNVSRSMISKWETGGNLPRARRLKKLAKFLNCTVDDLLEGEGKNEKHSNQEGR